MYTDPIADYLTRVRNAQMAGHKVLDVPASNMKKAITEILHDKGYILNYKFEDTANNQGNIKIALKYNTQSKLPAIKKLIRISKPGLRKQTQLPLVREDVIRSYRQWALAHHQENSPSRLEKLDRRL